MPKKGHKISEETKRKKLTEEHKRKLRLAKLGKKRPVGFAEKVSGKNNNWWKGGITPLNAKIRSSFEYKLWRKAIFERDNYTCIWCGTKSGNGKAVILNADHIKPFALFPEL